MLVGAFPCRVVPSDADDWPETSAAAGRQSDRRADQTDTDDGEAFRRGIGFGGHGIRSPRFLLLFYRGNEMANSEEELNAI